MDTQLKILILEDSQEDVLMVERTLKKEKMQFSLYQVDDKDEYVKGLNSIKPDVILSDHTLPQFNSVEALEICQRIGVNVPFILVTGTVSEEFAVTCLKNGADNYVLKGNLSRLPMAITAALQQREAERNRKQAEKSLHKQNQMLIKVNQELDRFVYSASHNLRSPLMSILGLLNISRKEVQNGDVSHLLEYFDMMNESIDKLDNTLKEIVDYSKNARIDIKVEKINIRKLLTECLEKLKFLEGADRLKTEIEIDGSDIIYCDSYRLSVIFVNLISNSIKYRDNNKEENNLEIHVKTTPTKTFVSLTDNGIGIYEDYVDKVFEMFYRASDKSNGAGLGLYIVKETVERLRGKISMESAVGIGSTVDLEFPYGNTNSVR